LFVAGARRYPLRQDPWHQTSTLAYGIAGTAPTKAIALANTNRPNGLGDDG
jgi:hypothetical protein